jgi:glycosyltransferase involved in cell wall biosynthesis
LAIVSLLFNWPSTGGGTVHTAELGKFLGRAGYDVRHIYAVFADWGLGNVTQPTGVPSVAIEFDGASWNAPTIQQRFRDAVDDFAPDYVVITDTWNFKPIMAEALRGYRFFLRMAALECLCPLNNVRLLIGNEGKPSACPRQQLATPSTCRDCVASQGQYSGSLHQAERALSGFGTGEYSEKLMRAFAEAEGVLVVNPLIATMVAPFARAVHVVPSGFDPARFPWPWPEDSPRTVSEPRRARLIFAGLVNEYMKGYHVVHAACERLWQRRQDFELVATADPPDAVGFEPAPADEAGWKPTPRQVDEFTHYIGWLSQDALPREIRQADILVFPTIAEEALGRTAVEAMGVGRPVIASRIGGLPFTVTDGLTGLLCEPGDADDLAAKIEILLDDPVLRHRMGEAGRKRFEADFTWDAIIDRHYRRLMPPVMRQVGNLPHARQVGSLPHSGEFSKLPYTPRLLVHVDHGRLVTDAAAFFGMQPADVTQKWDIYRQYSERQGYARRLGELKTLSTEEAFLLGMLLSLTRPAVIVELGTQYGKSTKRLVDLTKLLGLEARVISYDVVDELREVGREEFEFRLADLTGRFRKEILDQFSNGIVFSDAHPYPLLSEVVRETIDHPGNWALAIHDCGLGLCNPQMPIGRDDPNITSATGLWERHVLAEVFGFGNPLDPALDVRDSGGRRMRIFATQHGLGLNIPSGIIGDHENPGAVELAGATACA